MSANAGPSRLWYWAGGGVIVVGLLVTGLLLVLGIGALSDEVDGFQRVPFGGSGEVSFSEPGGYVLYHEGEQASSSGFEADIEPLDGGEAEAPARYGSGLTYDLGGRSGTAVGTIRILRPGRFRIDTTSTAADAAGQLAVGRSLAPKLLFVVLGGLALGFGSLLVGATTLIVTAVKRQRARR